MPSRRFGAGDLLRDVFPITNPLYTSLSDFPIYALIPALLVSPLAAESTPASPAASSSEKQPPASAKRITLPFQVTPTGPRIVEIKIGNNLVRLMLDTGAGGDILDTPTVERLQLKIREGPLGVTKGVGGTGGAIQALAPVECQLGGEKSKIGFHTMSLAQVKVAGGDGGQDGILGSPFLRMRHAVIDFWANTVTFDADPS